MAESVMNASGPYSSQSDKRGERGKAKNAISRRLIAAKCFRLEKEGDWVFAEEKVRTAMQILEIIESFWVNAPAGQIY